MWPTDAAEAARLAALPPLSPSPVIEKQLKKAAQLIQGHMRRCEDRTCCKVPMCKNFHDQTEADRVMFNAEVAQTIMALPVASTIVQNLVALLHPLATSASATVDVEAVYSHVRRLPPVTHAARGRLHCHHHLQRA